MSTYARFGRTESVGLLSRGVRSGWMQTLSERVDGSDDLPDTRVGRRAGHELAGARSAAPP